MKREREKDREEIAGKIAACARGHSVFLRERERHGVSSDFLRIALTSPFFSQIYLLRNRTRRLVTTLPVGRFIGNKDLTPKNHNVGVHCVVIRSQGSRLRLRSDAFADATREKHTEKKETQNGDNDRPVQRQLLFKLFTELCTVLRKYTLANHTK